jgi:tryptophan-rich sensory protein
MDRSLLALAGFGGACAAAAVFGARATSRGLGLWYSLLRKPPFQPPKAAFGPVWTVLYGMIADSGRRVFLAPKSTARTVALGLWGTQLALNAAWSPLFFAKRRPRHALVDLGALLVAIGAYVAVAARVDRKAAIEILPYAAWSGFAGALNAEIVRRNPRRLLEARF